MIMKQTGGGFWKGNQGLWGAVFLSGGRLVEQSWGGVGSCCYFLFLPLPLFLLLLTLFLSSAAPPSFSSSSSFSSPPCLCFQTGKVSLWIQRVCLAEQAPRSRSTFGFHANSGGDWGPGPTELTNLFNCLVLKELMHRKQRSQAAKSQAISSMLQAPV